MNELKSLVVQGIRTERNVPKNGEPTVGFYLHGNAPAHRSVLFKDFLTKNKVTTLEHPPYPPDLAASDFFFLPGLSSEISTEGTALL